MKLAEILRRYRKENAVSMDALAAKASLSKGYISMIENGKNARDNKPVSPTITTLAKLASVMGMSLDDLLRLMDSDSDVVVNDGVGLRHDERELLAVYNALNKAGRADALQRLLDMTEISRYKEDTSLSEELTS